MLTIAQKRDVDGEMLTTREIAERFGIPRGSISNWAYSGLSDTELIAKCRSHVAQKRMITFDGKTLCLTEWAAQIGIDRSTLRSRLKNGTVEDALTKRVDRRKGRRC
jgi:hypothetical protein